MLAIAALGVLVLVVYGFDLVPPIARAAVCWGLVSVVQSVEVWVGLRIARAAHDVAGRHPVLPAHRRGRRDVRGGQRRADGHVLVDPASPVATTGSPPQLLMLAGRRGAPDPGDAHVPAGADLQA
jgi:hypothetical protein